MANGGTGGGGGDRAAGIGGSSVAGPGGSGVAGAAGTALRILSIDFVGAVPVSTPPDAGATEGGADGGTGRLRLISIPMDSSEVAGVKAAANWNSAVGASGSLSALALSDGTASMTTVTWACPATPGGTGIYGVGLVDAPGTTRMLNGYLDPTSPGAPASVIINGLPPEIANQGYDVYVYTLNHANTAMISSRYTLGGITFTVSQIVPAPTAAPVWVTLPPNRAIGAANYLAFRGLHGASFTLTAMPNSTVPRAPVNGIQIVSPSGS
jgi:hypothetical protein